MALKGTTIESVHIDVTAFKHEDTTIDFHINLSNIYGDPVRADSTHTFTAKVANKSGYLADFPCAIDGTNLLIDSDEFFELAPDDYLMEIWETWTNEDGKKNTAIYPSPSQVLQFTINPNIKDKTGKIIETIDFKTTIENTVKDFLKNHPGAGTGQDIDLSDYYKKSDIDRRFATKDSVPTVSLDADQRKLTINDKTIDIPASVDLSGYAKKDTVPSVVYDADKHLLTINGQEVALSADVDLSNYYTKNEVDDKLAKAASGGKVDLTGYLTKTEAGQTYATKAEIPSVDGLAKESELQDYAKKTDIPAAPDLTPYLKSVDADKKYAAKSDIPSLDDYAKKTDLPKEPDLSGYETKQEASDTFATKAEVPSVEGLAKESDIPKVVLDVAKRTLTINGQTVDIPGNVDLSRFYTKDEVDKKLTDIASGGKVDLTGYLTKVAADDSYLTKDSIVLDTDKRILKLGGQTINIPSSVDLSGYLTKTDAEEIYAKKEDLPSLNGYAKLTDIPSVTGLVKEAELADYAKKTDLAPYLKTADADKKYAEKAALDSYLTQTTASATYATKAEIPAVPDMSQYAKKSDIPKAPDLSEYAKSSDVAMVDSKAAAAMDKAVAALAAADKASSGAKIDYDKLYDGFADKIMTMKF